MIKVCKKVGYIMSLTVLLKEIDNLKKEIDQYRPLDQHMRDQIKEYFRIGLTYSSNALEGNTLTETETKIVLEDGITVGGKSLIDHLEAIGHSQAYDFLYDCTRSMVYTEDMIKKLHHLFYYRINEQRAGVYRTVQVVITGSQFALPKPIQISQLMKIFVEDCNDKYTKEHPVIAAAQIHKQLVYIHPFIDGNGRIARLLMNLALLRHGYTIAIIPPIMRTEYIRSLEIGHKNDTQFIELIAQMVKESQKDYLRLFH